MKHPRKLIHTDRLDLCDYGDSTAFVNEIAEAIAVKYRLSGGWTVERVINEAFCQAKTLLLDFSPQIFFEGEYYNEAVKTMPLNVANAVFSVVYVLLRETDCMGDVIQMIENKLTNRPIFNTIKSIKNKSQTINFYPDTEYFKNADYVNWRVFTENFRPDCIWRILFISQSYEFHAFVAKGILGQLKSYVIESGRSNDELLIKSENMLLSCIDDTLLSSLYFGDSATESLGYGFPMAIVERIMEDRPETIAELRATRKSLEDYRKSCEEMKTQIARAEKDREAQLRASEEYQATIEEMKRQLGRSHISLNTIADCILRLPTLEMQYSAFQQVNTLLTGTAWSDKAQEVLTKMFSKVEAQSRNCTVNIENFNNTGTYNDNSTCIQSPSAPKLIK